MAALSSRLHGFLSEKQPPLGHLTRSTFSTGSFLNVLLYSSLLAPVIIPIYRLVRNDYRSFLSLGPGGTPSTFTGYLRVTFLRIFVARTDTYVPPPLSSYEKPVTGYLHDLPNRRGPRPTVAGIAPHRQTTQKGSPEMQLALANAFTSLESSNASLISTGISCFEHHNLALFFSPRPIHVQAPADTFIQMSALKTDHTCVLPPNPLNQTCGRPAEIAHLHTIDSSMHMTLHPADAAVVINRGWGERHPLAGRGSWVPRGFVMVYAPRSHDEIDVLMEIVRAGAWWVGGCTLKSEKSID